jgi:hypothetical protein
MRMQLHEQLLLHGLVLPLPLRANPIVLECIVLQQDQDAILLT